MQDEQKKIEDRARELKNAYYRKWRRENRDKVRASELRYWIRRAQRELAGADQSNEQETN